MKAIDTESLLVCLRAARRETILAWDEGGTDDEESPRHLMNSLLNLEFAIVELEKSQDPGAEAREAARIGEAERSEIRGMVAASQGRPSS